MILSLDPTSINKFGFFVASFVTELGVSSFRTVLLVLMRMFFRFNHLDVPFQRPISVFLNLLYCRETFLVLHNLNFADGPSVSYHQWKYSCAHRFCLLTISTVYDHREAFYFPPDFLKEKVISNRREYYESYNCWTG